MRTQLGCRNADKVLGKETRWLIEHWDKMSQRLLICGSVLPGCRGRRAARRDGDDEEARRGGISARGQDSLR